MKLVLSLIIAMFSLSAMAFSELECDGRNGVQNIRLVVDGNLGGSYWKHTRVQIRENTTVSNHTYTLSSRGIDHGFSEIRYEGAGLQVTVSLWPDRVPRWSGFYRATARSSIFGNGIVNLNCRFPNAH